jgi:hypothetical protein
VAHVHVHHHVHLRARVVRLQLHKIAQLSLDEVDAVVADVGVQSAE